jgi:hypothetical protein
MEAFRYRYHPLARFAAALLRGGPFPASAADDVVKMRLTGDACRAAGLPPRGR